MRINPINQNSFKGYVRTQSQYGSVQEWRIDKGWHGDIKKITEIKPRTGEGLLEFGVYYADINEFVDRSKLPWNVNYLVEYQKPDSISLSDIKNVFDGNSDKSIYFLKLKNYAWAWKDHYQRQYDNSAHQAGQHRVNGNHYEAKIAEEKMQSLSNNLYKMGERIDAYESLDSHAVEANKYLELKREHQNINNQIKHTESVIQENNAKIAEKEARIQEHENTVNNKREELKKQQIKASPENKIEYVYLLELLEAQIVEAQPFIDKIKEVIESIERENEQLQKQIEDLNKDKQEIENDENFINADKELNAIFEKMKKIYDEVLQSDVAL